MAARRRDASLVSTTCGLLLSVLAAPPALALTQVTGFGSNPGNLLMYKHVPAEMPSHAPLVVVLPGCFQTAAAIESTGWSALANTWKFYVVYAQQQSSNNGASCFNWFEPRDYARGSGEALSIKQMVDRMKADHSIDPGRVFVSGFSAGGAMSAVMAAAYPDVFSAAAVMAGIPYKCASGSTEGFSCMNPGRDRSPHEWGELVRGAVPGSPGPWPRVTIWHGTSDTTVVPSNMSELVQQWTDVHGIDQDPDEVDVVRGYPHRSYQDGSGQTLVETYEITGMGHAVAIDPQTTLPGSTSACGTTGAFINDKDICSTLEAARFFGLDRSDNVPPQVVLTSPADGATVSGTVTIAADATDAAGVSRVEFFIDGALAASDVSAPYAHAWNTATATNGSHVLAARAFDAAGNSGSAAPITVTVTGGISDTTPPTTGITSPAEGATIYGSVNLQALASDDVRVTRVEFYVDAVLVGTGVSAGGAGPYQLTWNTTSVGDGTHALESRAYDAAGNVGTSPTVTVTVDQSAAVFRETWSDNDGDADPMNADNPGWTGSWTTSSDDVRGLTSRSAFADLTRSTPGGATKTLSRTVSLGADPRLGYWRKLDLRAAVNTLTSAKFEVLVNGGAGDVVVDSKSVVYGSSTEPVWTQRVDLDLSAYAHTTIALSFRVTVSNNVYLAISAKAWVDDVTIGPPTVPPDQTPPIANVASPATGATVSGTVDVSVTASDDVGVARVELYLDGELLATDTSAPYVLTWDTTRFANGSHALMAKAYDAANNIGVDNDTEVAVSNSGGTPVTVSFASVATEDGYVKANADGTSAVVGTLLTPAAGRGSDGRHNRAVLSFDTSSLPETATITRAWLTVTSSSTYGDPWASPAGNSLVVDVKNGTLGTAATEAGDWGAEATASAAAALVRFGTGVSQSSSDLSAAGLAAINTTGRTQVKLRFALNPTSTAYVLLKEGADARLIVEYRN